VADGRVDPEVFAGADAGTAPDAGRPADVEIGASFSAQRLRHLERPRAHLRIDAGEQGEPREEKVRENLPARVEPGRTYERPAVKRVVGVRLRGEGADRDGG
jgi:hypothetical protein